MKQTSLKKFLLLSLALHILLFLLFLLINFYAHLVSPPRPPHVKKPDQPEIRTILIPLQGPTTPQILPQPVTPSAAPPPRPAPVSPTHQKKSPPEIVKDATEGPRPLSDTTPVQEPELESAQEQQEDAHEQEETVREQHEAPAQQSSAQFQVAELIKPARKSIASLTSGFLKSLRHGGNSLLERDGDREIPSLKELKYLSYQRRIDAHLLNSWRIVSRAHSFHTRPLAVARPASITFEIGKNGELTSCALLSSSGSKEFDDLVMESLKRAEPFPPIPDHLGISRYQPIGGTYRLN